MYKYKHSVVKHLNYFSGKIHLLQQQFSQQTQDNVFLSIFYVLHQKIWEICTPFQPISIRKQKCQE